MGMLVIAIRVGAACVRCVPKDLFRRGHNNSWRFETVLGNAVCSCIVLAAERNVRVRQAAAVVLEEEKLCFIRQGEGWFAGHFVQQHGSPRASRVSGPVQTAIKSWRFLKLVEILACVDGSDTEQGIPSR